MKVKTLTIAAISLANLTMAAPKTMAGQVAHAETLTQSQNGPLVHQSVVSKHLTGNDDLGSRNVTWTSVPEPRSAALGAIGLSIILLRRRK